MLVCVLACTCVFYNRHSNDRWYILYIHPLDLYLSQLVFHSVCSFVQWALILPFKVGSFIVNKRWEAAQMLLSNIFLFIFIVALTIFLSAAMRAFHLPHSQCLKLQFNMHGSVRTRCMSRCQHGSRCFLVIDLHIVYLQTNKHHHVYYREDGIIFVYTSLKTTTY